MGTQQIINDISTFISNNGGQYRDWYVGITSEPEKRLFTDHSVNKQNDKWIHAPADTNDMARAIEKHFLDLGCDGGGGGGDYTSKTVYAYQKNSYTSQ